MQPERVEVMRGVAVDRCRCGRLRCDPQSICSLRWICVRVKAAELFRECCFGAFSLPSLMACLLHNWISPGNLPKLHGDVSR